MSFYDCTLCNSSYTTYNNLQRHIKNKHPESTNLEEIQNSIQGVDKKNIQNSNQVNLLPIVPFTCYKCGQVNEIGLVSLNRL